MTHQHTSNGKEWLLVEVPSEAAYFGTITGQLNYMHDNNMNVTLLPSGTWSIHSDSLTITDEQARDIAEVDTKEGGYTSFLDYVGEDGYCRTACTSYHSLLRSKQINSRVINLVRI